MGDSQKSTKLESFTAELKELLDRFQYILVPTLDVKPTGIVPVIKVHDVPPTPKKSKKPNNK